MPRERKSSQHRHNGIGDRGFYKVKNDHADKIYQIRNGQQPDARFFIRKQFAQQGKKYKADGNQYIINIMQRKLPERSGNADVSLVDKRKRHHIFKHIDREKRAEKNDFMLFFKTQIHYGFSP